MKGGAGFGTMVGARTAETETNDTSKKERNVRHLPKALIGSMTVVLLIATCAAVYGMASKPRTEHPKAEHPKAKAAMTQFVYVCPDCHVVAMKAGKCKCGKDLVQKHLLGVKDGQAMLCDCPADCKCDAKGIKDGKCACGKEVKMASCKGLYCCAMGCPMLSHKPGKCACGMDLKKCE